MNHKKATKEEMPCHKCHTKRRTWIFSISLWDSKDIISFFTLNIRTGGVFGLVWNGVQRVNPKFPMR